jgi:NarL family two-component system sensor histidine kinase LiaS
VQQDSIPLQRTRGARKRMRLHVRMTLSYVIVTTAVALVGELLIMGLLFLFLTQFTLAGQYQLSGATGAARWYALMAFVQAHGSRLDPQAIFAPNPPAAIAPPADVEQFVTNHTLGVVLLIAPTGQVLASSYPARYPVASSIAHLLPGSAALITHALSGHLQNPLIAKTPQGRMVSIAQTVWSQQRQPIGAVYVQASLELPASPLLRGFTQFWMDSALLFLLLILPMGALYGMLSTRGLVRRIERLVITTAQFAAGQYSQRVPVSSQDEIGQLEDQFNQMAQQLVESMQSRQKLTEQNARLAERAHISRELHDALAQDLFSLRVMAEGLQAVIPASSPLSAQITTVQQITETMLGEMRALLLELRPAQLERLGLKGALEDLAASYRSRLGIAVTTRLMPPSLPTQAEHTLLRIAQEALSNAARHADATAITLELVEEQETISFTIADNGVGFLPECSTCQHGLGLHMMEERAQALGGFFHIETAPGQGTRLLVRFPHEAQPQCTKGASR